MNSDPFDPENLRLAPKDEAQPFPTRPRYQRQKEPFLKGPVPFPWLCAQDAWAVRLCMYRSFSGFCPV